MGSLWETIVAVSSTNVVALVVMGRGISAVFKGKNQLEECSRLVLQIRFIVILFAPCRARSENIRVSNKISKVGRMDGVNPFLFCKLDYPHEKLVIHLVILRLFRKPN